MRQPLYPYECRQAKISYSGQLRLEVLFQYDNGPPIRDKFKAVQFPIMLMSKLCHLRNADPQTLVQYKEEASEMGGYFILNGCARVVPLLILPKRNYPISRVRDSFREGYCDQAVVIRCVRDDHSAVTVKLFYLCSGTARIGFWIGGREYLLPVGVVLKALSDTTDHELYSCLTCCYDEKNEEEKGAVGTQLIGERAKIILDEVQYMGLLTRTQCIQHIGEHVQPVMQGMESEDYLVAGETILKRYIFVHLKCNYDKFNLLVFMLQKLFSLVDQTSLPDNPDSPQNQEVLGPGHLITIYLKDKLQEWLSKAKGVLQEELSKKNSFSLGSLGEVKKIMERHPLSNIGASIESLLKNGYLASKLGLDLQQFQGTYLHHKEIKAGQGVKITAQLGLEHAVVGTDLYVVGINDDVEDVKEEAMEDVNRRLLYLLA
ncbi:hypothetical protein QQ045_024372 [Rhodiola kirilowii]